MSDQSRSVLTQDGIQLRVTRSGPHASHGVCVFIHGHGEGAYVWQDCVRRLAHAFPIVTIDLRGHGDSDRSPQGSYDLHTYVADVVTAISTLKIESALIVGHSLGGQIAMHLAARELRHMTEAAVLVDISPNPDPECSAQISARLVESLRHYASLDEYANWLLETRPLLAPSTAHRLAQGALRACASGFECRLDPVVARTPGGARSARDWNSVLAAIACPTLVVRGAMSALVDAPAASAMAKTLRHGSLVTIPAAGHAVMTDNPEAFGVALEQFIRALKHKVRMNAC